jgi:hypothetical protein
MTDNKNFTYTAHGITVTEYSTGFSLEYNGKEVWLGDGVDMFTSEDGESPMVGTDEFYSMLRNFIDHDPNIIDAYFGDYPGIE